MTRKKTVTRKTVPRNIRVRERVQSVKGKETWSK